MNIELYINKQLCDIQNVNNFSIYLKRQFFNPSELSTKDAQKSYNITLPATAINNRIFGFKNTEEVRGKFAKMYDAYLVIGGVKIFEGKFRLSEVGADYYAGNLGVPVQKTIKEIFGDLNMNEIDKEWDVTFGDFAESVKKLNNTPNAPCIFPYVMYGLLPKNSQDKNNYTEKNEWDDTVSLNIDDFPPSINCLEAIKKIFDAKGFKIAGSAYRDERLTKLYMSYKNPAEYEMLWNYGHLGKIMILTNWSNYKPLGENENPKGIERAMIVNTKPKVTNARQIYTTNLLSSVNGKVEVVEDRASCVQKTKSVLGDIEYDTYSIRVPCSGLYKIELYGEVNLNIDGESKIVRMEDDGKWVFRPVYKWEEEIFNQTVTKYRIDDFLKDRRYEIKLIRSKGGGFNLQNCDIDREFYKNNIDQEDKNDAESFPKFFPEPGEVCFIDPYQNKNLLCGLSFGITGGKQNPYVDHSKPSNSKMYSNAIAIKGGTSWNVDEKDIIASAVKCRGYKEAYLDNKNQVVYADSSRYKVEMENISDNLNAAKTNDAWTEGYGTASQIVWLEKGELITAVACCDASYRGQNANRFGATMHDVVFNFSIEAFQTKEEWLLGRINAADGSTKHREVLNWKEDTDFPEDCLNLFKFLPSNVKVDSWLENFTKAFNLSIEQKDKNEFELNVRQPRKAYSRNVIDLDTKADVNRDRKNTSLNLPSVYELGFKIEKKEWGYTEFETDGGGRFETGNTEGKPLAQQSEFSYNWFKEITFTNDNNKKYLFPVISENEPFEKQAAEDYAEMVGKYYPDLPQRFWYKGENLVVSGLGANDGELETTLVRNELPRVSRLDYYNKPFSILNNFFTVLVDNDTHYTVVECFLSPDEYNRLPYSYVKFNGDLYYPAEVDGYDPLNKRKATLKLLRKIL